jgi:stearoyl-CoA desaturase (delta-9 desaturase)
VSPPAESLSMSELSSAGSAVLAWASGGLLQASGWQVLAFTLLVTIAAVTIFLHRAQAHRALELHALPSHFFRFWLWLTTGMVTKEWVAIHRKHHAKCETDDDPHSPVAHGIRTVLLTGSELYRAEAKNADAGQVRPQHARTTGSSATSTAASPGRAWR